MQTEIFQLKECITNFELFFAEKTYYYFFMTITHTNFDFQPLNPFKKYWGTEYIKHIIAMWKKWIALCHMAIAVGLYGIILLSGPEGPWEGQIKMYLK